jgi:hypothetical protein
MGAVRALRPPMSAGGHSGRLSILQAVAIDDVRVGAAALRMLVALGTYADTDTGWCRVRMRTIGDRLGVSRQAASKALSQLAQYGYVEIRDEHDPRTGSRVASSYRLIMDFDLPDQYRRTPQPDIAGGVNLTLRTPTPDVAVPVNPGLTGTATPEIAVPATSEVAAIEERPKVNDSEGTNTSSTPSELSTAWVGTNDQAKILRGLSAEAREILDFHRQRHGRRQPAKLTPESALVLEAAVADLGVERLRESIRYMAGKIPPVPELSKAIRAARTKRERDENPIPPPIYRNGAHRAATAGSIAARTKSERF